jgi:hypothetical protein
MFKALVDNGEVKVEDGYAWDLFKVINNGSAFQNDKYM